MNENQKYTIVEGIKCFSPGVANDYANYPDSGFDLTDENSEKSFWVSSRNRLFKRMVEDHIAPEGKTKFLEVGCGVGGFIQQIAGNDNLEITGSEIYLKGLKYAQKKLPDVEFIQFDVTSGTIDEQFDIISAFDVIEHIEDDGVALSNINKMLNQNGTFIITVPQHMFLWSRLDEIVNHKRRYSRRELSTKLQENGFTISYASSFLFILFPLMVVSRLFDKGGDNSHSPETELEKRVTFSGVLNYLFDSLMRIDETLIHLGISLPFGGTLLIVAEKS